MLSSLLVSHHLRTANPMLAIRRALLSSSSRTSAREALPITSRLEVERKFRPSDLLSHRLAIAAAGQDSRPCHTKIDGLALSYHTVQVINDRYFDIDDRLALAGLWVRRRIQMSIDLLSNCKSETTVWEVKQSLNGDYVNSAMVEYEGRPKVVELWRHHFSRALNEDKDISTDLDTYRKVWTALPERDGDGSTQHFLVVLDKVTSASASLTSHQQEPFMYTIGEVEKTCQLTGGYSTEEHEQLRQQVAKDMNSCIASFMRRYSTLFETTPPPVGKLSALAAWRRGNTYG